MFTINRPDWDLVIRVSDSPSSWSDSGSTFVRLEVIQDIPGERQKALADVEIPRDLCEELADHLQTMADS